MVHYTTESGGPGNDPSKAGHLVPAQDIMANMAEEEMSQLMKKGSQLGSYTDEKVCLSLCLHTFAISFGISFWVWLASLFP
jgi:hypothetical protein